ncbi:MAG TPA: ribonuclease HII [Candidatus Saccharimonadales bacterium]|nr:ribonuclease HII [Candidatus Saccharimonadales bacterium]
MVKLIIKPSRNHEAELWGQGASLVAGVDEVGRGSWAGPVTAAAVILPRNLDLAGVRDSKLLSPRQRHQAARLIKSRAVAIGVGWASPAEIDSKGLNMALRLCGLRALARLHFDAIILDGRDDYLEVGLPTLTVIKGDQACLNVAAASIIAKVARDNYMARMHELYPDYGFMTNVGYGTAQHTAALVSGLTPIHRRSYKPVRLAESYGY